MLHNCPGWCQAGEALAGWKGQPASPAWLVSTWFSCTQMDSGTEIEFLLWDLELDWKMQGGNWFSLSPAPRIMLLQDHGSWSSPPTSNSWDRQTMARSEQSDLGCEFLWHIYTNKSFTVDRLIREVLAETQNQCQCPNPTSSMSNGTFEAWFLETLPPVGSSDASGRDYSWHF